MVGMSASTLTITTIADIIRREDQRNSLKRSVRSVVRSGAVIIRLTPSRLTNLDVKFSKDVDNAFNDSRIWHSALFERFNHLFYNPKILQCLSVVLYNVNIGG